MADPQALVISNAAKDAYDFLGSARRANSAIAQAVIYRRDRAEIERGLYGVRRGEARGEGGGLAAAAQAHPQCADQADEVGRLWLRLSTTITTRRTRFPARTISRANSAGRPSMIRSDRGFEREIRKRLDYWAKAPQPRRGTENRCPQRLTVTLTAACARPRPHARNGSCDSGPRGKSGPGDIREPSRANDLQNRAVLPASASRRSSSGQARAPWCEIWIKTRGSRPGASKPGFRVRGPSDPWQRETCPDGMAAGAEAGGAAAADQGADRHRHGRRSQRSAGRPVS